MKSPTPPGNAKTRFSSRVADYVRWRPSYPAAAIECLRSRAGLRAGARVADLGSGTGISSRLLLEADAEVFAVEPNAEMGAAAVELLGASPLFHPIAAPAEATGLPEHSIDLIVSAQAFHWFDRALARTEFTRILKPHASIALLWNRRLSDDSEFLRRYEALLNEHCGDYSQVRHENVQDAALDEFFLGGVFEKHSFPNSQQFDFEGLRGRLLSSSYAPPHGDPRHEPMIVELKRIFQETNEEGLVAFLCETNVYIGR